MKSASILLLVQWLSLAVLARPNPAHRVGKASSASDVIHSIVAGLENDEKDSLVTDEVAKLLHGETGQFIKQFFDELTSVGRESPSKKSQIQKGTYKKERLEVTKKSTNSSIKKGDHKTTDDKVRKIKDKKSSDRVGTKSKPEVPESPSTHEMSITDFIHSVMEGDKEKAVKFIDKIQNQGRKGVGETVHEAIHEVMNGYKAKEQFTEEIKKMKENIKHLNRTGEKTAFKERIKSLIKDVASINNTESRLLRNMIKGLTPRENETEAIVNKIQQFQANKTLDQIVNEFEMKSKQMEFMAKLWMDKGIPLGYGDTVFTNSRALAQLMTKETKEQFDDLPAQDNAGARAFRKLALMTEAGHSSFEEMLKDVLKNDEKS